LARILLKLDPEARSPSCLIATAAILACCSGHGQWVLTVERLYTVQLIVTLVFLFLQLAHSNCLLHKV